MPGCDLEGADLTRANLYKADLYNAKLPKKLGKTILKECNLSGMDLSACNLEGAVLIEADLTDTILPKNLKEVNFYKCKLPIDDFSDYNLEGTCLSEIDLKNVKLPKNLKKVNFTGCDLSGKDFSNSELEGANLSKSILKKTKLPKNLKKVNFIECDLSGRDLSDCDLEGANISLVNITGTKLPNKLKEVHFVNTDLSKRDLSDCDLRSAVLSQATLKDAILPHDLTGTQFLACNLVDMDLSHCDLRDADLSLANLSGTVLPKSLRGALLNTYEDIKDFSKHDIREANLDAMQIQDLILPKDLQDCSFRQSNLSGMDLYTSDLEGADLSFADLRSTTLPPKLKGVSLEGIKYDSGTSFPPLEDLKNGMLNNILGLTIDIDSNHKNLGKALLKREFGVNPQKTKDKIVDEIMLKLINKPSEALETLYYLRLNNSKPDVKLDLELNKNIKKYKLDKFERALVKTIFSGDNKQMILKKYQALKLCLEEESLRLPLKEYLFNADKEELDSFLVKVYNFSKLKDMNSDIIIQPEYQSLLEAFNRSSLDKPRLIEDSVELKVSDYARILNQKDKVTGRNQFIEAIYSDTGSSRINLEESQKLEKLKQYCENKPDLQAKIQNYKNNKNPRISAVATRREIDQNLQNLSHYVKKELLSKIASEYKVSENTLDNFINNAEAINIEALFSAFAYREQVHTNPKERDLIDKLIVNYLEGRTNQFINEKAEESWAPDLKAKYPNFDSQKLRKEFVRDYGGLTFKTITKPIEMFLMSYELEDFSCLSLEGSNRNKLLNHALNAQTSLISIEEEGF